MKVEIRERVPPIRLPPTRLLPERGRNNLAIRTRPDDEAERTVAAAPEPDGATPLTGLSPAGRDLLLLLLLRVTADVLSQAGEFAHVDRRWVERYLRISAR